MTALEIVGREEELTSVRAFLDGTDEVLTALVLEGDAGIGKIDALACRCRARALTAATRSPLAPR